MTRKVVCIYVHPGLTNQFNMLSDDLCLITMKVLWPFVYDNFCKKELGFFTHGCSSAGSFDL